MNGEFILTLLHAITNTHILHLQSKSYAQHMALGAFYPALDLLVDTLAETIQGITGEIIEYEYDYYKPCDTPLEELESLRDFVVGGRGDLPQDTDIQNIVDEVEALINATVYKLKFLK